MKCKNTGYSGRTGIYEIFAYTLGSKQLTTRNANLRDMHRTARESGLIPLWENGIKKMLKGYTTSQEILRVTWEQG